MSLIGIIFTIGIVLWIINKYLNMILKRKEKMLHHNRCQECGSKLNFVRGHYAPTCAKCSHVQTWSQRKVAT